MEFRSADHRSDSDFIGGIDNEALDFGAALENFIDPPQVDATTTDSPSICSKVTNDTKSQTLPESPPDSSGSPPSVYSPLQVIPLDVPVTLKPRKRRRENDDQTNTLVQTGSLCELLMNDGNDGFRTILKDKSDLKKIVTPELHEKRGVKDENEDNDQQLTAVTFQSSSPENNSARVETYQPTYQPLTGYYNYTDYGSFQDPAPNNGGELYPYTDDGIPATPILLATHSPTTESQSSRKQQKTDSFDDSSSLASITPDSNYNPSSIDTQPPQSHMVLELGGPPNPRTASTASSMESGITSTPLQCIRFESFQPQLWHQLCDHQLHDLPAPHYRVDADKGFNFSASDDAFVCQKKNHFQVTCHAQLIGYAGMATGGGAFNVVFVRTQNGLEKVRNFCLHFYGVKFEAPRHVIRVEQSQSDRSKKPFHPVVIDLQNGQVSKTTVGRLHFSETTSNNMRKKGRPNPEQRYFRLVVGLHAHTHSGDFPIVAHGSEKIIVRASNPGQFESDFELCWQRGITPDSIFHNGKIGLNTDSPDECLVVNGNLKVTGHILQPSDCRIKRELSELNTRDQLENIQQIRIVKYHYDEGMKSSNPAATGVMAQEVRKVLPDAVFEQQNTYKLPGGGTLDKFLVVNKERIFLENVGAVKELSKVTVNLEQRIAQLESIQSNGRNWNKFGFSKSESLFKKQKPYAGASLSGSPSLKSKKGLGSHSIQLIIVIILVVISVVCLSTLATLFFMEHYNLMTKEMHTTLPHQHGNNAKNLQLQQQQNLMQNLSLNSAASNSNKLLRKPQQKNDLWQSDNDTGQEVANKVVGGIPSPPNWNNIEFSFLYIYKLQQYYNLLRKKVKGKITMPPFFNEAEVLRNGNEDQLKTKDEVDCDGPSDCEQQLNEEELLNRLLENILSLKNSTVPTRATSSSPVHQQQTHHTVKHSKKSTLVLSKDDHAIAEEGDNKEFKDHKREEEKEQRTKLRGGGGEVGKEREQIDIENLINSN